MTYLNIEHFKCFVNANIPINKLTVFAGANANGKSTSIQALLFLRQTIEQYGEVNQNGGYTIRGFIEKNIALNGEYLLLLGNSSFVLNKHSDRYLVIGLHDGINEFIFTYEADNQIPQLWLHCKKLDISGEPNFPILKHEFYYLNAERLGPRVQNSIEFFDYLNVGWQGERTGQVIDHNGGYFKIDNKRVFPKSENSFLNYQVNKWLDFIIPGVKVKAITNSQTLSSQITLENQYTVSEPTLATNLGFGISYLLPIIATGLIAEKDSYFIVENPEAHLHPSAQSKVGRFLSIIANSGVNVIIETHSDHVINGIQIATAKGEILNNNITINYFNNEDRGLQPDVSPITLSPNGELSAWPKGFFDQTQIDFSELLKARKNV